MGTDCVDICDAVLEVMCHKCPNWKKCQNSEDEANHQQMLICMGSLKMTEYTEDFEPIYENCCVCGKPAEGGCEECDCTCPTCGEKCFDDSEFGDHNECYDCHKKSIAGTTYGLRDMGCDDKDEGEKK